MTEKILLVDDDIHMLDGLQRLLRRQFNVDTAVGGTEALHKIATHGPFALVVADMQMPGMSGLDFLRHVQVQTPATVRLMLTGNADQKTAVDAVNDGRVFRFLNKPCPGPTLTSALEAGLEHYRFLRVERDLLENTLGGAISVLTEILSTLDPATFERSQTLRETSLEFAEASGLALTWEVPLAASLLSIGRVTVPPALLEKVRQQLPLSELETNLLRQVPELGARLLEKIPRLENVVAIVRYQQRHFDGSDSPNHAIAGLRLPFGARLLKFLGDLVDFESQGLSRRDAWQKLNEHAGHYDPDLLVAASAWCQVTPPPEPAPPPPQEVNVEDLRSGQILAQDVFSTHGLFLLAAETRITAMLVVKLLNFRRLRTIGRTLLVRNA
jgi:response regulator RpfG family c-di-GMP phosphodiesterase